MSKDSFNSAVKDYFDTWVKVKKSGDTEFYKWFLKETRKEFSKLYTNLKDEAWIEQVGKLLKLVSCELKEINIKYKKEKDMASKEPSKMTDAELLEAYKTGAKWASENMGKVAENIFNAGLKRLENIETEMQARGVIYG